MTSKPSSPGTRLAIKARGGSAFELDAGQRSKHQELAMRWAYLVRHRSDWSPSGAGRADLGQRAMGDLKLLGLGPAQLEALLPAGVIEVQIPFVEERRGWEYRVMPWESLITAAAKEIDDNAALTVIRHLNADDDARPVSTSNQAMIIQAAPGQLAQRYAFDSEIELLTEAMRRDGSDLQLHRSTPSSDPNVETLTESIRVAEPAVLHFTGIDTHEGAQILGSRSDSVRDGVYLSHDRRPTAVDSEAFAAMINAAAQRPQVFSCNTFNSGSRVTALATAHGCAHTLGFQDLIDDTLGELFFVTFYRAYASHQDVLRAFQLAIATIQDHPIPMRGSCVILWSRRSLLEPESTPVPAPQKKQRSVQTAPFSPDDLTLTVRPFEEINYSLLHNRRPLFREFQVSNRNDDEPISLEVELTLLHAGSTPVATHTVLLEGPMMDISDRLTIPLTWRADRYNETVRANLSWVVRYEGAIVRRDTPQVSLLPIDVWRDRPDDWAWLPSFVLPRDPAIHALIDRAQRYLCALTDDAAQGFEGYQSSDPALVDRQVQAIWSALILDYGLAYTEPPPTYARQSQRVRNPSRIMVEKRGTCIDLTLLFAACLEYVGIGVGVFLLKGHALPAYWRSSPTQGAADLDHAYYVSLLQSGSDLRLNEFSSYVGDAEDAMDSARWVYVRQLPDRNTGAITDAAQRASAERFDNALFGPHEIQVYPQGEATTRLRDGPLLSQDLVPLEATFMTSGRSFMDALDEGWARVRATDELQAFIDVPNARGWTDPEQQTPGVTPLPYEDIQST
ncbi:MAG: hypothetical protein AAF918_16665 [Pseudomonadota bacterium]